MSDDPLRFYDGEWFTIGGSEFDFLAIDDKGQVAVFSHGGWGPIPRGIVDRWEEAIKAVDATDRRPVTTTAQGHWADQATTPSGLHGSSAACLLTTGGTPMGRTD